MIYRIKPVLQTYRPFFYSWGKNSEGNDSKRQKSGENYDEAFYYKRLVKYDSDKNNEIYDRNGRVQPCLLISKTNYIATA